MTSILTSVPGNYFLNRTTSDLLALRSQFDRLSTQLSSGRVADTYAGLGLARSESLDARSILSALAGYDAAIANAKPRVELTSTSLAQISQSLGMVRTSLTSNATEVGTTAKLARAGLDSTIDALKRQFAGRYIFGGLDGGVPPVASADVLLDGDTSDPARPLAGLNILVSDQIKADQGAGTGRLTVATPTPGSVLVLEDADAGVRANFGFMLAGPPVASGAFAAISYSASAQEGAIPRFSQAPTATDHFRVVANQAGGGQKAYDLSGADLADISSAAKAASSLQTLIGSGKIASVQSATPPGLTASFANVSPPASFTINIASQPVAGDQVSIKLALHDGTATTLTLQAQRNAEAGSTTDFTIGVTPAATAQNFSDTLQRALNRASETALAASATVRATQDFFAGSSIPGLAPRRIQFSGPTPSYIQTPPESTVIWYKGETSATDPRATTTVRTGSTSTAAIGARANEEPIRAALTALAAVAVSDRGGAKAPMADRFKEFVARTGTLLSQKESLEGMSNEFGLASRGLSEAQEHNKSQRAIFQSELDGIENVSIEELVTRLVDTQNRLQASYQVTSMLSKLTLVNYLR
ncbi:hypothetical protein TSA1_09650 [Bradyrhizobium nitroreducens]|uniref:Flagellin C-terminal domain-containing protein n=1 Tax=Bradyrhizobium nitroreducens TaxID=709803 RepID=A0A2M6UN94_9BRAD|nr:hypothetical protein [Bradyrhizobium nitroreducens]PIT05985.1 hypothetical protein TSA1_09650 [Bradyrhizobium nitroreducens]